MKTDCVKLDCGDVRAIMAENARRQRTLDTYNPITGEGCCGERVKIGGLWLPKSLVEECGGEENVAKLDKQSLNKLRIAHDFEFWCAECVTVKHKIDGRDCKLVLNRPQRRVLRMLEEQRMAGKPIRLIMLKARQWGGSTLVQVYMAWIQIVLRTHCNSLICGHLRDTSATIRGMYKKILDCYPEEYQPETGKMKFSALPGSRNVSTLAGRNCSVVCGTAGTPEGVRSMDITLAHLTEVAFWPHTPARTPDSIIRSVCGTVAFEAGTMIVMESTANGIGNYFHNEWLRAKTHRSAMRWAFVPWYEIEIYTTPAIEEEEVRLLCVELDEYEKHLWDDLGLSLEQIRWYHLKRREYTSHSHMKADYPTDDVEAFANSGNCVFPERQLNVLRSDCTVEPRWYTFNRRPSGCKALSDDLALVPTEQCGDALKVWHLPDCEWRVWRGRYVVSVDVGGCTERSDFSVITVIDRFGKGDRCEIVAEWRGHTHHDVLAWRAAQVAQVYGKALLVIESNTLETEHGAGNEGDGTSFVLAEISRYYGNLYVRRNHRQGFHTNRLTKLDAVFNLMCVIRDHGYTERNAEAVTELGFYEHKPRGAYGAREGFHDDMVMTRAIGLLVARDMPGRPERLDVRDFVGGYI